MTKDETILGLLPWFEKIENKIKWRGGGMNETRAPTEDKVRQKVLADYRKGIKPKELAEKTGISINTIKSWISREKKKEAEKAVAKKSAPKKKKDAPGTGKKGAPFGNQNAKGGRGGAAPLRNKNAEKHGAYSKIYWDSLDEEELSLINSMGEDEEEQLIMQIQMFSVRERRLMQRIKNYKEVDEKNHGLAVKSVSKKKVIEDIVDSEGQSLGDGEFKKSTETTVTNTEAVMNSIMTLESELTKVQRAKTKAIESLSKIRLERDRLELDNAREQREADLHELQKEMLDAQIEHLDASTNKLLGTDTELEDTSDTDALIYGDDNGGAADEE